MASSSIIREIFPVMNRNCQNGIFEPLEFWDKDDWRNKNRRNWTEEELSNLYTEICDFPIELKNREILLVDYNREESMEFVSNDKYAQDTIFLGRIIKMGTKAFNRIKFKLGADATYNDWVFYNLIKAKIINTKKHKLIVIKDTDLWGLARDPKEFKYY